MSALPLASVRLSKLCNFRS